MFPKRPEFKFCPVCSAPFETGKEFNVTKKSCTNSSCGYVFYDNPDPIVAGIVQLGNDIVMVQNIGWPEHWFGLVTGYLEAGEKPEVGILRELKEETGLDGKILSRVGDYPFPEMNQLVIAFHIEASGEINIDTNELQAYKLIPVEKLKPWPFGAGNAVREWLEQREKV